LVGDVGGRKLPQNNFHCHCCPSAKHPILRPIQIREKLLLLTTKPFKKNFWNSLKADPRIEEKNNYSSKMSKKGHEKVQKETRT
jgi:hypothetical protein